MSSDVLVFLVKSYIHPYRNPTKKNLIRQVNNPRFPRRPRFRRINAKPDTNTKGKNNG